MSPKTDVGVGRRTPKALAVPLLFFGAIGLFVAVFAFHHFLVKVGAAPHPVAEVEIAGRRVAMWKPAGAAPPDGYPVILFSHGFTGCGTQSVFLTEALAQDGYFVLAPNHRDGGCGGALGHEAPPFEKLAITPPQAPFGKPEVWTDTTYRDRGDDLEALLDTIFKDASFQGIPIDFSRIGLAGHSLGGYTVLALAGAWPSWKDRRVKAVLGLSPFCAPFFKKGGLGHLDVPVMYQGGTLDIGITPTVRRLGGAYDLTSSPKFYLELAGAGHFAWTNPNKSYQPTINAYALAFFDRYLKGATTPDPLAQLLEQPWPRDVSDVRYALK
jgi:predicted dienelactone hydrolase